MVKTHAKILIVDDEETYRYMLNTVLTNEGYQTAVAGDGIQAINALQTDVFDIALLDIKMPKVDGIDVLKFIKETFADTEVVMLTGVGTIQIAVECMKLGAYDFLMKPYSSEDLLKTIRKIEEKRSLLRENQIIKAELLRLSGSTDIIGNSPNFKRVLDVALKVATTSSTILIQGASGTGKELVANYIYKNSDRADKHFVVLNCASIPDTLIESELFGHEKGAFTDARTMKKGLVEIADTGTLFLDEVGDISPIIQPKLLRFIQTGEYRRVGGNIVLKSDVRIISATNKDLVEEVKHGRFREDLLYRLNVITIEIPNLKDRKEDIPLLVEWFLQNKIRMKPRKHISHKALELLMRYDWPGNVRELENVIERAAILSKDDTIQPDDISLPLKSVGFFQNFSENNIIGTPVSMKEIEKQHIEGVLKSFQGNKAEAAKILGISLKTLYTKIQQYGIKVE
ncbi:MAG: sigma-54 dependent transcriptional regulator [Bacteroidetes bacterium]|nr:sigma-54 dependent transcriptional regulator [Bacteroidota bacterium]